MGIGELLFTYLPAISFYALLMISSLIGSYTKIYVESQKSNLTDEEKEEHADVPFGRIIISTFSGLCIVIIISEFYTLSLKFFLVISYIAGILGYQIVERITTIEGFLSIVKDVISIVERVLGINRGNGGSGSGSLPSSSSNRSSSLNSDVAPKTDKRPNFDVLKEGKKDGSNKDEK